MNIRAIALYLALALCCVAAELKESKQYGAKRLDFAVGTEKGFVIQPTKPAADGTKPWVWYAPTFIGQLPDPSHEWMAKQLLDAGFAICGVEIGESYGSPTGVESYNRFYSHVRAEFGLDKKVCLLPQSRGGLMAFNWAAENPEKVACIGGIYTVCNLESYPGLAKACEAYGITESTLRENLAQYNPIDRLKPLAEAKVPLFFVHGDSDVVVPIETNSGEVVKRYRALGGPCGIKITPGKGHEVCTEFFQSQELIGFLLSQGKVMSKE